MMYAYGNMISSTNRLFSGVGSSLLWNGLQAYYTADNTSNDALGTYNGTLVNGATYGTGIINQGFSLDGVNDTVDFGNVLDFDGSTPFSISTWVYPRTISASSQVPIAKALNSGVFPGYWIVYSTSGIAFVMRNTSTTNELSIRNSFTPTINTWYNILITYDGSKSSAGLKVYVNGSLGTQVVLANTLTGSISTTQSLKIGARQNTNYSNSIVDETAFWNRELTSSEVTELYNSGVGKQYPN